MTRIVYVNGEYCDETAASVSVFDRGFLFSDAVYEVTSVVGAKLIDFDGHMARLDRSLSELDIPNPLEPHDWLLIHRALVARNMIQDGLIYLQVSRGVADRDFLFPTVTEPTVVLFTQSKRSLVNAPMAERGLRVISQPDLRWGRRDIKTVQLLYPSMAKTAANRAGADDAWLVDGEHVTEGSSNNAYIVKGRTLVTRNLSSDILHGITRAAVLRLAQSAQYKVEERAFTLEEAKKADEAFVTSASAFVMPVVEIDGVSIGNGEPGPITRQLRAIYIDESLKRAI